MNLPTIRQLNGKYVKVTDVCADFGVCVEMEGFITPRNESRRFVVPVKDLEPVDRFPNYADNVDVWERLMRTSQDDVIGAAVEALTLEKQHDLVSLILRPKSSPLVTTGAIFKRLNRYTVKEKAIYLHKNKRDKIEVLLLGSNVVTIRRNEKRERLVSEELIDTLNEGEYIEQAVMSKVLAATLREALVPFLGPLTSTIIINLISKQFG